MKSHFKENIVKNLFIVVLGLLALPYFSSSLSVIQVDQLGNFLLILSILLVTVCFANFAFTYEKAKLNTPVGRLLAHAATFIFMLLIFLMLESMCVAVYIIYPSLYQIVVGFSALLYLGIALYDFWDFLRAEQ